MDMRQRARKIFTILKKRYPNVDGTVLHFSNPLELLVATILSAQCTDEKVNEVTAVLFKKFRTASDYATANQKELETIIRPTGFFHRKARLIIAATKTLVEEFDSIIPQSIQDLVKLPGVARKTANIVLSNAYGVIEGIAVDTHVFRLAQRLGFSSQRNRDKIEQDLIHIFPKRQWFKLTYLLIAHGRTICMARHPKCNECPLNHLCPSEFTFNQE